MLRDECEYYVHNFGSDPPETPFAPSWNVYLIEKVWDDIDCDFIFSFLIKKYDEIVKLDPVLIGDNVSDGNTKLGRKNIMSRYSLYNVFNYKNTHIYALRNAIVKQHNVLCEHLKIPLPEYIYLNGWINLLSFGEKVAPHIHSVNPKCYLGGNFCVRVMESETIFINPVNQICYPETYHSINEPGKLTLFENRVPHYSSRNFNFKKRMTISFNIRIHDIDNNAIRIKL
tara:strand:+ start:1013 stop:1696 length:684 start_codon:yes stop_codon:yes gene_type:complete